MSKVTGYLQREYQLTYIKHWIKNLISDETILQRSFSSYIDDFQNRYTTEELEAMEQEWVYRFNAILQSFKEEVKLVELVVSSKSKQRFFVIDRDPDYKYEKIEIPGEGIFLVASDGPLVNCYRHETPSGRFRAFAGREFDIPMKDGTVIKADGQWWDDTPRYIRKDCYDEGLRTLDKLTECFVFCGHMVKRSVVDAFLATNPVPKEYNIYQTELVHKKRWRSEYDKEFKTEDGWEAFYSGKKSSQIRIDELEKRSSFLYRKMDAALEYFKENTWNEELAETPDYDAEKLIRKIMVDLQDGVDRAYKPEQEKTDG